MTMNSEHTDHAERTNHAGQTKRTGHAAHAAPSGNSARARKAPHGSASATVELVAGASPQHAWEISVPADPTRFYPKFGPLPAVIAVADQTGTWDSVGRTRRLLLSDGGSVIEHIREVQRPHHFAYELTDFQKLFGHLVEGARAEWTYTRVAGGTSIRWNYTFHPKPAATLLVRAIVALAWAPYMRKVLPGIVRAVEADAQP